MPAFRYEAIDSEGKANAGIAEGESAHAVAAQLREKGWQVSSIEEARKPRGFSRVRRPLTAEDLDLLNEQLLALTESGLALSPALAALAKDVENKRLRPVIEELQGHLEAGASLEEALSKLPGTFPAVYTSLVRAGERSGNLPAVLHQLCTYSRRGLETRYAMQEAVVYPVLVLGLLTVFLGVYSELVAPQFSALYADHFRQLPALTRGCLAIGNALHAVAIDALFAAAGVLLALALFSALTRRLESCAFARDWCKLRIPFLGPIYAAVSLERFTRTLGMLLTSRAESAESLALAAEAAGNAVLARAGKTAARLVEGGDKFAGALAVTGYFGNSFSWLLRQGEENGFLDKTLLQLAEASDREALRRSKLVLVLAGPVMVILAGILVGVVVIGMFLPILKLSSLVAL